jgi:DNA-binding MarR family transcriptional regulator
MVPITMELMVNDPLRLTLYHVCRRGQRVKARRGGEQMEHEALAAKAEFDSIKHGSAVGPEGLSHKHHAYRAIVHEMESKCRSQGCDADASLDRVRSILKARRMRGEFFEASLFADPAWDILLELYSAELEQQRVSVGSLCIGAAVPATTALRWITLLETRGLIRRTADPRDGRRYFVSLSDSAATALERYFAAVPLGSPVA